MSREDRKAENGDPGIPEDRPAVINISVLNEAGQERAVAGAVAYMNGGLDQTLVRDWHFAGFGEDLAQAAAELSVKDPERLKTMAFSLTAASVALASLPGDDPDQAPVSEEDVIRNLGIARERLRTLTMPGGERSRSAAAVSAALQTDQPPWRSWAICALDENGRAMPIIIKTADDEQDRRDDGGAVMVLAFEILKMARRAAIERDGGGSERMH